MTLTVATKFSDWPATTEFGVATRLVALVAVEALTVTETAGDVLATKLEFPAYCATRL